MLGVVFYLIQVPLVFFWSIPFAVGGGLMAVAGMLAPEGGGPVEPPEGYSFCVFCGTPVKLEADRCPHCNGLQPKVAS